MDKRIVVGVGVGLCSFAVLVFAARSGNPAGQGTGANSVIARGDYLVTAGGCDDCHTPKNFTPKGPVPDMSRRLSGAPADTKVPALPAGLISPSGWGGLTTNDMTTWAGPWGVSFASNLTPDKTAGLGNWTEVAFIKAMRTGKHKGALRDILPPMPWQSIGKYSDADLRAIFAYLQSVKPVANKAPDPIPPARR